jgi:hypothetical protein
MTIHNPPPDASINEATPLLVSSSLTEEPLFQSNGKAAIDGNQPLTKDDEDEDDTPLPKVQILVLCIARAVEPIAFFGIFPFINKMIWETGGMDEEDVGYYSGLIVSSLSILSLETRSRSTMKFSY